MKTFVRLGLILQGLRVNYPPNPLSRARLRQANTIALNALIQIGSLSPRGRGSQISEFLLRLCQYLDPNTLRWYFKLWLSPVILFVLAKLFAWEL